jgi:hypothetical protein
LSGVPVNSPWRRARDTITTAAERVSAVASDTREAMVGLAFVAFSALLVALLALVVSMRRRTA